MEARDILPINPKCKPFSNGLIYNLVNIDIEKPDITPNGGQCPQLPSSEHKDEDTSSSDSGGSGDSGVDSGTSTGSTDSNGSGDSTTPLIKDTTVETVFPGNVNTSRLWQSESRPLFQSSYQPESHKDTEIGPYDIGGKQRLGDDIECDQGAECSPYTEGEGVSFQGSPKDCAETRSQIKKSFWIKVGVIFLILDILLVITILVISCGISPRSPPSVRGDDSCLKCRDVYLTDDDRRDNIYKFDIKDIKDIKDGELCCSKNQTLLIQKYVLKRYKHDHAKASAERYKKMPKRTAVHVDLDLQDSSSKTKGENQVLKWSGEDALINGHLNLTSSGTHIQFARAGLYYVNSKVVFADTKASAATKESVLLLQVYRRRGGRELLLLENKSSQCGDADKVCNVPSSAQGVFQMEGGDQVFVRVTKPCGLVLEPRYNYLEAYLV